MPQAAQKMLIASFFMDIVGRVLVGVITMPMARCHRPISMLFPSSGKARDALVPFVVVPLPPKPSRANLVSVLPNKSLISLSSPECSALSAFSALFLCHFFVIFGLSYRPDGKGLFSFLSVCYVLSGRIT
jgi:hypothetical protein